MSLSVDKKHELTSVTTNNMGNPNAMGRVSSLETLAAETNLPANYRVISYKNDEIELSETERRDYVVVSLEHAEKQLCWLISSKSGMGQNTYFSVKSKIKNAHYTLLKELVAENSLISRIYEIRNFDENLRATKSDSTVVAFFELMLSDALSNHISDIHIQLRNTGGQIKMRKHGEMRRWGEAMSEEETFNLCSVIYNVLAENKQVSFDPREYQPAAVNYKVNSEEVKLRYQSLPVYPDGFDVVLRVLPIGRDEEFTPLTKLGYTDQQVKELIDCASRPIGSLIIAGVTGSGKSTTLKNLIMFINAHSGYKLKIYTIEDPPEYKIPHVSQIPVIRPKEREGSDYNAFLAPITACMRADPDIIMIGEVRDGQTGGLTKKAIQSGHQVLTTVHAASAIGIIDRFLDFGVSEKVLGSPDFLTALIYQKLLATVCPNCSIDFKEHLQSEKVTQFDIDMAKRLSSIVDLTQYPIRIRSESGCDECGGMGIKGRAVCAEIIKIDLKIMEFIINGDTVELIKYWRGQSDNKIDSLNMKGKNCMEHAVQKMLTGLVSPFDVEASFKPLDELYLEKKEMNLSGEFTHSLEELEEKLKDSNTGSSSIWEEL